MIRLYTLSIAPASQHQAKKQLLLLLPVFPVALFLARMQQSAPERVHDFWHQPTDTPFLLDCICTHPAQQWRGDRRLRVENAAQHDATDKPPIPANRARKLLPARRTLDTPDGSYLFPRRTSSCVSVIGCSGQCRTADVRPRTSIDHPRGACRQTRLHYRPGNGSECNRNTPYSTTARVRHRFGTEPHLINTHRKKGGERATTRPSPGIGNWRPPVGCRFGHYTTVAGAKPFLSTCTDTYIHTGPENRLRCALCGQNSIY